VGDVLPVRVELLRYTSRGGVWRAVSADRVLVTTSFYPYVALGRWLHGQERYSAAVDQHGSVCRPWNGPSLTEKTSGFKWQDKRF